MKKLLLLLLICTCTAACVDSDYDLSDVDTGGTAIGDSSSEFRIPLATIGIGLDEIGSAQRNDIREMFADADTWLPTSLPAAPSGQTGFVDLTALDDTAYTDRLFDALFTEMEDAASGKLGAVTELVLRKYKAEFARALGIPETGLTSDYFRQAFLNGQTSAVIRSEAEKQALRYLTGLDNIAPLDYDLGSIDIDGDVVDMLVENLDERNTLHLYGEIVSGLPVAVRLTPVFTGTDVGFAVGVEAAAASAIDEVRIFEQDLRTIVGGTHIRIPVRLERYYPAKGFSDDERQLVIRLKLVKRGALNLDL